jgi:HK97 family phage portal protein
MGLFSKSVEPLEKPSVIAQYAPHVANDVLANSYAYPFAGVSRAEAMSVPAIARCNSLIKSSIAAMPLEIYKKSTGEEIPAPLWVSQPSRSQAYGVTIGLTVDALFHFGVAYWEVVEQYSDSGKPARFDFVQNDRVTFDLSLNNTVITQYYVDGEARPMTGLYSLVTFQGIDEGILNRGKVTIRQAIDVQKAAAIAAMTPQPSGFLKNSGADLPPAEVQGLLAAWKQARQNRSTAYLTSTLDYVTTSYSPKEMGYVDQIQNLATEISRMCNVPAYYVSADQNTSLTYANIIDERKQLVSLCFQPFISAIEDRLSMDDISNQGHIIKFDLDKSFLRVDPMERLLVTEKLLALGLITTEQAMEMEDLSPNGNTGDMA